MYELMVAINALIDRAKQDGVNLYVHERKDRPAHDFIMEKDGFCVKITIPTILIYDNFIPFHQSMGFKYDRWLEELQDKINESRKGE